jgi:hypothetical protein
MKYNYATPQPRTEKHYKIAVCIKRKGMDSYRVDFEVRDEEGAMLLARLLQEHDEDVLLTELSQRTEYQHLQIRKWGLAKKAD